MTASSETVTYQMANLDGLSIFSREAGPRDAPTLLLPARCFGQPETRSAGLRERGRNPFAPRTGRGLLFQVNQLGAQKCALAAPIRNASAIEYS